MSDLMNMLNNISLDKSNIHIISLDAIEIEEESPLTRSVNQAKTCRYIPLRGAKSAPIQEEFQYRQIEEENQQPTKGQDYKD